MANPIERTLTRPGQPALSTTLHLPEGKARGAILLTHGYAEHRGRYDEVVAAFVERGFAVGTWDLRGHGKSEGHRGHVERFAEYLKDADDVLASFEANEVWREAGKPLLVGHSLGGLITFHLALSNPGRFGGVVLSSPFFGLAMPVPGPKVLAGKILSKLAPSFGLPSGLSGKDVTKDPEKARLYDEDPFLVKKATARWFTEASRAQVDALANAPALRIPIVVFAGGADKIASVAATKALFERIGSSKKELRVLDGEYHEIWNEIERADHIAAAADALVEMRGNG